MSTSKMETPKTAPEPLFRPEILKELFFTGLITLILTATMVGLRISDASSGPRLLTRFTDVLWAVAIVIVGRIWLILLREKRYRIVLMTAAPIALLMLFILLSELLLGKSGTPLKTVLPFNSVIVHWMVLIPVVIFALRGLIGVMSADKVAVDPGDEGGQVGADERSVMDKISEVISRYTILIGPLLFLIAIIVPFIGDRRDIDIAVLIVTYIMLGWGLNIVVGLAGLLDLGYVGFYAVGAYTYALLATQFGLSFWISLPIAGLIAAIFGVVLGFPVLRLRGDYLAIVTLGFGEIIRIVLTNWQSLTNGPDGINKIPSPTFFGLSFETKMDPETMERSTEFHKYFEMPFQGEDRMIFLYFLILILALLTNLFTLRVRKLPVGRAWEALREDEIACRSLGINPTNTKLTAFGLGAMFAGFAGSFFATRQSFISPESFTFIESAVILAIVVLGGFGSQIGVVIAAVIMIGAPEVFRELKDFRMLFFGLTMVLIMLWRPSGLLAHRDPTIRLRKISLRDRLLGHIPDSHHDIAKTAQPGAGEKS